MHQDIVSEDQEAQGTYWQGKPLRQAPTHEKSSEKEKSLLLIPTKLATNPPLTELASTTEIV